MREILFRGKRTDNGKWALGYLCKFNDSYDIFVPFTEEEKKANECHIFSAVGGLWYTVNSETVGQFTGLTDKNGKKIFEGDIIKAKNKFPDGTDHEAKVVAELDDFYLIWCIKHSIETEVIGNIHDNPELLEVNHD